MTYDEIIQTLKTEGDPRAVAAWERMGLEFENYYGFNLTRLKALSKQIKKDHALALELWKSNIHDARLLATYIEDPQQTSEEQIDAWMKDVVSIDLGDKLCENVIAKTPYWDDKIVQWTQATRELTLRAGFILVYIKAKKGKDWSDEDFIPYAQQIRKEIKSSPNWAKEAMNMALIAIGRRGGALHPLALGIAQSIGKIVIDYGDTSCKNPDAVEVLSASK